MGFNPEIHHRRSIRLQNFDYSKSGAYFLTVCSHKREQIFGLIENDEMKLNEIGKIVQSVWNELLKQFPNIRTDEFVVMPNHVHGIIWINPSDVGARFIAPNQTKATNQTNVPNSICSKNGMDAFFHLGAMNRAPTLGIVVRYFKGKTAFLVRKMGYSYFRWQRNYYERIIRSESELNRIREYIRKNPSNWENDAENR